MTTISPREAWELFLSEEILLQVIKGTNVEGQRIANAREKAWLKVDQLELKAWIGLCILSGSEKSWDVAVRELFGSPFQNPMYKATMSINRFEDIRRALRFDDKRTRPARLATEHMAAFRDMWEMFLVNCRRRFIPNDCVTVDEQLVPFRGRCKFLQYMPSKPAKYGIKIFWVCDARVPYAIDAKVYTGRQPGDEVQKNLGEKIVKELCSALRHTGRNITMDNFFTTIPLAQELLESGLTIVGTLRQNKPDIPAVMKASSTRKLYSTEFGFNGNVTMASYVRKKGKVVVLLSTMHQNKMLDENSEKKKPEIITFYNKSKGGVDLVDQMVGTYTCKRQTQRWPMVLWYNMLDVATLNAYSIFKAQHPNDKGGIPERRLFLRELSRELILPQMQQRLEGNGSLNSTIIDAMQRCGVARVTSQ